MSLTLQSPIDLARIDLNDTDAAAYRHGDPEMLKHANAAMTILANRAPHLWHGNYSATPNGELSAITPWPIQPVYVRVCADLIVAFAETKDDEHTLTKRVQFLIERAMSAVS